MEEPDDVVDAQRIAEDELHAREHVREHGLRGEAGDLVEKIRQMKGVQDVQQKGEDTLEFQFAPGQDLRPDVARLVVQSNHDLLEMRSMSLSLEEIFLELTRNDAAAEKR